MKCPKCKYTTFDYLDSCPRCGKDLVAEKAKLNIFSYKPNPLFLLGSLTGDLSDSAFSFDALKSAEGGTNVELKPDEVYDDGSELDITIDEKTVSEPDKYLELDIDDLDMSPGDKELELDFTSQDSISEIEKEAVKTEDVSKEKAKQDYKEIDLESGDLKLNLDLDDEETKK